MSAIENITEGAFYNTAERQAIGKARREQTPRADHGNWQTAPDRRNPIDLLEESNRGRVPELVPIRYGRMLADPFVSCAGRRR
jgi:hypothetical protein